MITVYAARLTKRESIFFQHHCSLGSAVLAVIIGIPQGKADAVPVRAARSAEKNLTVGCEVL
jgi:hypothetical protein